MLESLLPHIFLPGVKIPAIWESALVVIPTLPVLGNVWIGFSFNNGTYPLLPLKSGLLKNAEPDNEVNLALYNLNVISWVWSSVQREPFWDLNNAPAPYCVVYINDAPESADCIELAFTATPPCLPVQTL